MLLTDTLRRQSSRPIWMEWLGPVAVLSLTGAFVSTHRSPHVRPQQTLSQPIRTALALQSAWNIMQ
ncbi:hypothetical protein BD311DRAFT_749992 [Dichomitus squalens]|uniref:Uncharacterized protein n=1 Tax=Dichomitus squalens TaxID=114155 RepID=A0A4Q9N2H9_9APHY|nr:hypothetical protein BD311DRAFT_749992 [Dichomitus squalens]